MKRVVSILNGPRGASLSPSNRSCRWPRRELGTAPATGAPPLRPGMPQVRPTTLRGAGQQRYRPMVKARVAEAGFRVTDCGRYTRPCGAHVLVRDGSCYWLFLLCFFFFFFFLFFLLCCRCSSDRARLVLSPSYTGPAREGTRRLDIIHYDRNKTGADSADALWLEQNIPRNQAAWECGESRKFFRDWAMRAPGGMSFGERAVDVVMVPSAAWTCVVGSNILLRIAKKSPPCPRRR